MQIYPYWLSAMKNNALVSTQQKFIGRALGTGTRLNNRCLNEHPTSNASSLFVVIDQASSKLMKLSLHSSF